MLTIIGIFRRTIRTVISGYILYILQEADLKKNNDKHLSSLHLYNEVNRYILMTFKTLWEILENLEKEQKIKRTDSEIESTSKPTKETLWAFSA